MKVIRTEPIVKTYYNALEEGKLLGRKCTKCGHVEFPPFIACNACGNLDTEWVDLTNVRAKVLQVMPPLHVFPENEFKKRHHGYMVVHILVPNADPYATSLVNVDADRYEELYQNKDNLVVRPVIVQDEDVKICLWELDEPGTRPLAEILKEEAEALASEEQSVEESISESEMDEAEGSNPEDVISEEDEIVKVIIECAAGGYEVDESKISLKSDIREDLSNESIKMIVMISEIEDALGVTIEITEAANLNTIEDFVRLVKKKMQD